MKQTKLFKTLYVSALLVTTTAFAGEGGWSTKIRCNDGAMIVEVSDSNSKDMQIVIFDRGVINYFAEGASFMYYGMYNAPKWMGRSQNVSHIESIDFTEQIESTGRDAIVHSAFKIARQGNGMHVNLVRIDTWGEGGYYDETDGMWRGFTAKKAVSFLRNWYFQSCSFN